jgi:hypothetical protein
MEIIAYDPNTAAVDEQIATVELQWDDHGFGGPTWSTQSGLGVALNEGDEWPTDNADFEDIMGQTVSNTPYEYGNIGGETDQTVHMDFITSWNCCSGGSVTVRVTVSVLAPDDFEPPEIPDPEPGSNFDIFDPDDLALVAELDTATNRRVRVELDGAGSGAFSINTNDADADLLAKGQLCKVTIPRIWEFPIASFWMEAVKEALVSPEEEGGEVAQWSGRGGLAYLERARMRVTSFVTGGAPGTGGVWRLHALGTGDTPGSTWQRVIRECTHPDRPRHPLAHMTWDFNYDEDSTGDPWDDHDSADEFTCKVGETALSIGGRLLHLGMRHQMSPDLTLHSYNEANFGRDLTGTAFAPGVVRFAKGVNIHERLERQQSGITRTDVIVQGEDQIYRSVGLPELSSQPEVEDFISVRGRKFSHLESLGRSHLRRQFRAGESVKFKVVTDRWDRPDYDVLEEIGYYLPGPEGSNGHYWVGDLVTIHTGTGPRDFNNVSARVVAITIEITEEDDLEVEVELMSMPRRRAKPLPTFFEELEAPIEGVVPTLHDLTALDTTG